MAGLVIILALTSCKSEGGGSSSGASSSRVVPGVEPALAADASKSARKLFVQGQRLLRARDFTHAADLFQSARERHAMDRPGADDDFLSGCRYYEGLACEGQFAFDEAREIYSHVMLGGGYSEMARTRILALTVDTDGDGYADAWEDAEGTNPGNPLSHP